MSADLRNLMRLAARQHQVFSTAQADNEGIESNTLAHMARRGHITSLGYGLWACAGAPNTYRRKLAIAQLSLGGDTVFTGRTTLWLRRVITQEPSSVDVLVDPDVHLRPRPGMCFFRGARDDDSSVNVEGHTTTSIYRAFSDVSKVTPVESLTRWLAAMDRLRLGHLAGLDAHCAQRGRFPGVVNLRAAVATLRADLPHSGAEKLGRTSLRAAGIAPYPRPYPVSVGGITLAEIDIAFPRVLYGAEVDGPHHLLREVAAADRIRDRRLRRMGWTIDRFSAEEVAADPTGFVREVQKALNGSKVRNIAVSNR